MSNGQRQSTQAHLPIEIHRQIFLQLNKKRDLCLLAIVSRTFQLEAERILYHTVDLTGSRPPAVFGFCHTVEQHSRKARYVRSLCFPSSTPTGHRQKVAAAFRAMVNLKEFTLARPGPVGIAGKLKPWMFDECTFSLHKYHNHLDSSDWTATVGFLLKQSNIRDWSGRPFQKPIAMPVSPVNLLPHLSIAQIYNWEILKHVSSRVLRHLNLKVMSSTPSDSEVLGTLHLFRTSITHLSI